MNHIPSFFVITIITTWRSKLYKVILNNGYEQFLGKKKWSNVSGSFKPTSTDISQCCDNIRDFLVYSDHINWQISFDFYSQH